MKDNENNKVSFLVEDEDMEQDGNMPQQGNKLNKEQLKKPLIFTLMAIVCAGCLYLIFKPSGAKKKNAEVGLNEAVPQATGGGLQGDKAKAYETQKLDELQEEKKQGLASLSDYWSEDSADREPAEELPEEATEADLPHEPGYHRRGNYPLNSYRNAQNTLGSFYEDDHSETEELRRQVEELKEALAERDDTAPGSSMDNQLALMEKSYQMAAKYLPAGSAAKSQRDSTSSDSATAPKRAFAALDPARKSVVSALYREPTDSAFIASLGTERNTGFYTTGIRPKALLTKNSVRACVQQTQTVTDKSNVQLRFLEPAIIAGYTIPIGTSVTAIARFQTGRLQLVISSIELAGSIIPVEISIYYQDGQPGLPVPYSAERSALTDIAANMAQTSGTSIMMTRSASQQIAGDLSRGLVQGVSGYFSKKIKAPKVTLKAGLQVMLVSKK